MARPVARPELSIWGHKYFKSIVFFKDWGGLLQLFYFNSRVGKLFETSLECQFSNVVGTC